MKQKTEKTCCICGRPLTGWGNNPWPVKSSGECCNDCNIIAVIPARLRSFNAKG